MNRDYGIQAISDTELDINGDTCGDAAGTMTVTGNDLTGSVLSTNGFSLDVLGTVSDSGEIQGGFAEGGNTIASFTGSISGTTGAGDWEDNFECTGTWTAVRS